MIVGYARVSKKEQAEDSNAFMHQQNRLQAYGVDRIISDIESRTSDTRRGFLALKRLIEDQQAREVVVTRISRLSGNQMTLLQFQELYNQYKFTLTVLDETVDLSTAAGQLQYNILGAFSHHFIRELQEKSLQGYVDLRSRGVANPKIPFGYLRINERYELDPSKIHICEDIINFYYQYRSLEKTSKLIYEKYKISFTGKGIKLWLLNPVLCGHTPYKKENRILYATHPKHALLSDRQQQEIKEIIAYQARHWGANSFQDKWVNPFGGLTFCGECDRPAYVKVRKWKNSKGEQLVRAAYCSTRAGKYPGEQCSQRKTCNLNLIDKAVIDALVSKSQEIAGIIGEPIPSTEPPQILELRSQISQLKSIPNPNPVIIKSIENMEKQLIELRSQLNYVLGEQHILKNDLVEVFQDPVLWDTVLKHELSDRELQSVYHKFIQKIIIQNGEVVEIITKV